MKICLEIPYTGNQICGILNKENILFKGVTEETFSSGVHEFHVHQSTHQLKT
jgi:hypothetical protein